MAHMIPPDRPLHGPGHESERLVFDALAEGLSDDYFVYPRLAYVDASRGAYGEADFLIVHRTGGFLVVECKGHGVKRDGLGRWTRLLPDGTPEPLRENPYEQVRRHRHELVDKLEDRVRSQLGLRYFPFVHGHAVAFPRALVSEQILPLDIERSLLMDASDLGRVRAWVEALQAYWARQAPVRPTPLDPTQFEKFRRRLLHPALDLAESVVADAALADQALVRLSEDQVRVMRGLLGNPRFQVRGGAGTGKTVLALEAAQVLASRGRSVLVLCFTRFLGQHLRTRVARWSFESGRVEACTFHELCERAFALEGRPFVPPDDLVAAQHFWDRTAPELLLGACAAGRLGPWDAIIVDEGQDFVADWWVVIEDGLLARDCGQILEFLDPSQNLFRSRGAAQASSTRDYPGMDLEENFRNTRCITEVVASLGALPLTAHPRCPEGVPPVYHDHLPAGQQRAALDGLVRRLIQKEGFQPDQLTILTPHSRKNSSLRDAEDVGGFPLADHPARRDRAVLHVSIPAFKGLESDVVILADVDPTDARCGRAVRYTAASRARLVLHVMGRGNWLGGQ